MLRIKALKMDQVRVGTLPVIKGEIRYLVKVMPGLNHLFQHAETGSEYEYGRIEETMAPEMMVLVAEWIWSVIG